MKIKKFDPMVEDGQWLASLDTEVGHYLIGMPNEDGLSAIIESAHDSDNFGEMSGGPWPVGLCLDIIRTFEEMGG